MICKLLEIRDKATFIPAIAIAMVPTTSWHDHETSADVVDKLNLQRYLLRRCGYAEDDRHPTILLTHAGGGHKAQCDVYAWGDRTYQVAHNYIEQHWHDLKDGDVVCVETILGERDTPKISERFDRYGEA